MPRTTTLFTRHGLQSILLTAAAVICFGPLAAAPPEKAPKPPFPGPEDVKKMDEAMEEVLTLLKEMAAQNESGKFANSLYVMMYTLPQDPRKALERCVPFLRDPSVEIRVLTAEAFMEVKFRQDLAKDALYEVMELPEKHMAYMRGKSMDCRAYAARVLAENKATSGLDLIWQRYQESEDDKILFALAEMGDRRPLEVVLPQLDRKTKVIHYADLLGKLKAREAIPALKAAGSNYLEKYLTTRALYWITGDEAYLDSLIANSDAGSLGFLAEIKSPKVEALMKATIHSTKTMKVETALVTLHMQYPGTPEVRQAVIDFMNGKTIEVPASPDTIYRIGAALKDPEIDRLGAELDAKKEEAVWLPYYSRRDLPFRNPLAKE